MKKKLLLFTALFAFVLNASAQQSIVKNAFEQFVKDKVERMQQLINFDDDQTVQLKNLELNFLLDVNSADNSFWCNTKKRVKKLEKKRDEELQQTLTREQYLKYDAVDNDRILNDPPLQMK